MRFVRPVCVFSVLIGGLLGSTTAAFADSAKPGPSGASYAAPAALRMASMRSPTSLAQIITVTPPPLGGFGRSTGAPLAYSGPDAVHVHIQGSGQLYQESAHGWQPVCNVPCTTTVDMRGSYKIGGFLVKDSSTFQFPRQVPSLELVAKPASPFNIGRSILGWSLIGFGLAPAIAGGIVLSGGAEGPSGSSTSSPILGGVLVGSGIILAGIGVYLLLTPPESTLETTNGERIARRPARSIPLPGNLALTPSGLVF
jgi:hypothetical protein